MKITYYPHQIYFCLVPVCSSSAIYSAILSIHSAEYTLTLEQAPLPYINYAFRIHTRCRRGRFSSCGLWDHHRHRCPPNYQGRRGLQSQNYDGELHTERLRRLCRCWNMARQRIAGFFGPGSGILLPRTR